MSDNQGLYIEESIKNAVKRLLSRRVNELLGGVQTPIPPIEFGQSGYTGLSTEFRQSQNSTHLWGGSVVAPVIGLSTCERTEKERIIRLDAYSLTITFTLPETAESELHCYAYAAAVEKALREDTTLDGVASRAVMTGKKYVPPKTPHCGEGWAVTLALRVVVEGGGYAG